jgi:hypothetical protein
MGAAGVFAGLSIFLFAYDPNEDSTARILPAREFTGESELTLPKDTAAFRGVRLGLGAAPLPLPNQTQVGLAPPTLTFGGTLE